MTADFREALVLFTSNLGFRVVGDPQIGFVSQRNELDRVQRELCGEFAPELRGRLNDVLIFNPLQREQMVDILERQLRVVGQRLDVEFRLDFSVSEDAREWLISRGFSPEMGARAVRSTVERELEDPLSRLLLDKPMPRDARRVVADLAGNRLTFVFG